VTVPDYRILPATCDDISALEAALAWAIDWRATAPEVDARETIERTGHSYLLADWGRNGDVAIVARTADGPIGAAWYRLWSDELHSYGYVDSDVPELGIGVDPRLRGMGVGTALLGKLIEAASRAGVGRIGLSVECDNAPACQLYDSLGFVRVGALGNAWTMIRLISG
jgi:ribosomal protein S18 acetylase RimI-like enzyme